jgi:2'-5' RNA ligase
MNAHSEYPMSMRAIASLLPAGHSQMVERVWTELTDGFGLTGVYINPFPHFSYHVAGKYDVPGTEEVLRELARRQTSLVVSTAPPEVFAGESPIVYLPVVKTPELIAWHASIFAALAPVSAKVVSHYASERWIPHITLAQGDLSNDRLDDVMASLQDRDWRWEMPISDLVIISTTGTKQGLTFRVDLAD